MERFGLEGTLKIIWVQPPCHERGHLPLDQAAQSSIQPGLEHFQGGGIGSNYKMSCELQGAAGKGRSSGQ